MTTCTLCDLPTPDHPVTEPGVEGSFCCRGCLEVARTLEAEGVDAGDRSPEELLDTGSDEADGATEFFPVAGMHCTTCEAFLESRLASQPGVGAVSASYPAGLLKVVYDPDAVEPDDLRDVIDGLGYQVREDDEDGDSIVRLLVGGFFGMMVMCWYVLFLYPAYLGMAPSDLLIDPAGYAGRYLLWNVWLLTSVVLGYTGFPILRGAYVSLRARQPNMDLLIALAAGTAYLYSTVALALGGIEVYFDVAVVVVLAVTVGGFYEDRIRRAALERLSDLTEQRASEARRVTADGHETVSVEELDPGDEVVVGTDQRVPVDGTVVDGTAAVDESLLTGEPLPVEKGRGDEVAGGSLVTEGGLHVRVAEDADSTIDRLVTLLWDVQSARPGAQRLADRLAAVFVPVVLVLGLAAFGWHLFAGASLPAALLVGLAVLIVSCPCALGLATPLAISAGLRAALSERIVVTDGSVFERTPEIETIAFDKTGTLTTGAMELRRVEGADGTLRKAAAVEQFADHPVAGAVTDAAPAPSGSVTDFDQYPGQGVGARVDGQRVLVGRRSLFEEDGWAVPGSLGEEYDAASDGGDLPVLVGWDGRVRGLLVAGDRPREDWESVVTALASDHRVVVVTGDDGAAAERFREHPAIDRVFAGVPPEAKAEVVDRLRAEGPVTMVGDGSNDTGALAAADLGIALESGTRLAADAADAVIASDDLAAVPTVFEIIRAANRRIRENLAWAFCYNAIAIPLAVTGLLNPLFAAAAMATSSLLVVLNSSRSLAVGDDRARDDTHALSCSRQPVFDPAEQASD